jgi:hypothetical protein
MEHRAKGSDIAWAKGLQVDALTGLWILEDQRAAGVELQNKGVITADATGVSGASQAAQDTANETAFSGWYRMDDLIGTIIAGFVNQHGPIVAVFEFEFPNAEYLICGRNLCGRLLACHPENPNADDRQKDQ